MIAALSRLAASIANMRAVGWQIYSNDTSIRNLKKKYESYYKIFNEFRNCFVFHTINIDGLDFIVFIFCEF